MGMGYGAGFAEVIDEDDIRKFCPKEFKELDEAIKHNKMDIDRNDLAMAGNEMNVHSLECPEIKAAFDNLCEAFHKKTGLGLDIAYRDSESDGDRYDEVDGIYWHVDGMWQLTRAGKKMEKHVERKFFVEFG